MDSRNTFCLQNFLICRPISQKSTAMSDTMEAPQSLLIYQLQTAVREYNHSLSTLNAKEQEYASKNHEEYNPVSPEAEIDEEAWSAVPLEDIEKKLEDTKKRNDANEKKASMLERLLSTQLHPEEKSPSKAEYTEPQAMVEDMRRLTVGSSTKQERH